jgi:GT2 family glycosyltransferase
VTSRARDDRPAISLVVCTRDRAAVLPRALGALARLSPAVTAEVVLVDNASRDDTPRLLGAFERASAIPCRVISEARPGKSFALNLGWRQARGGVIAFTDDDCSPRPDYLDRMAALFEDPALGFVGGRVLRDDPRDLPTAIRESPVAEDFPPRSFIGPGTMHGANFAFRREVLETIGGFDEVLGAGTPFACEDCDVLLRASTAGFRGMYHPAPTVSHHHGRRGEVDRLRIDEVYLRGRGAFFVKHLARSPSRARTLRMWFRNARYYGFGSVPAEIASGLRYLAAARRAADRRARDA